MRCSGNRCKDRASGSRSLLNPRESLKFRRAFYRWWLLTNLFPPCYLRSPRAPSGVDESETEEDDDTDSDTDGDGDDDDDTPDVYLAKSHDLRKVFLSEFSNDEVVEMWQVYIFMVFVSFRVHNATSEVTMHDCESYIRLP